VSEHEFDVDVEGEFDGEVDDVRRRAVPWPTGPVSCGAVLDGFAAHCRDELADVELLEQGPHRLRLRWRDQTVDVALRADPRGCDRLPAEHPWLLVVASIPDDFVDWFVDRPGLADRMAIYGLDTRRKLSIVRATVPVYFEWYLREAYRVRMAADPGFTVALLSRGVISTGMG
jgi:hypothetical protein